MNPDEIEREWDLWLRDRKRPAPPDPAFTRQVMEAVRAEARRSAMPSRAAAERLRGAARLGAWLRSRPRGLMPRRPAVAFATLALAAVLASLHFRSRPEEGDTRIKGGAFRIAYLLKRGDRIAPAASGERFRPGDRLQAVYSADRSGHFRLYSLNASGRIGCLSCGEADSMSPAGQDKLLPFALELDGDPEDEALVGFWSPVPLDSALLESGLRAAWNRSGRNLSRLENSLSRETPAATRISVFLLRKKVNL